jgi:hypothetical protein
MKTMCLLALAATVTAGTLALAQNTESFPTTEFTTNAPTAITNRVMSLPDTGWQAMPPPGVSFLTGGVGRAKAPAKAPAAVPIP